MVPASKLILKRSAGPNAASQLRQGQQQQAQRGSTQRRPRTNQHTMSPSVPLQPNPNETRESLERLWPHDAATAAAAAAAATTKQQPESNTSGSDLLLVAGHKARKQGSLLRGSSKLERSGDLDCSAERVWRVEPERVASCDESSRGVFTLAHESSQQNLLVADQFKARAYSTLRPANGATYALLSAGQLEKLGRRLEADERGRSARSAKCKLVARYQPLGRTEPRVAGGRQAGGRHSSSSSCGPDDSESSADNGGRCGGGGNGREQRDASGSLAGSLAGHTEEMVANSTRTTKLLEVEDGSGKLLVGKCE